VKICTDFEIVLVLSTCLDFDFGLFRTGLGFDFGYDPFVEFRVAGFGLVPCTFLESDYAPFS
jgi:hypothetical protein